MFKSKAQLRRDADALIARFLEAGGVVRKFDPRGNLVAA
jgi:hypothetical protein